MYFFPLASKTPPFPFLCTLYNSLMTLSGELVGWALCAACEKRLPKITSRGINEKLIVLIVSVPQKVCNIKEAYNAALQRPGDNYIRRKLSMRDTLIPVRCKRLLCRV